MSALTVATERGRVMGTIQDCTACELHSANGGPATAPVPFRGAAPSPYMILGEAPGAYEDKLGRPFVGSSGKYLDRALREHALPSLSEWFVTNVVCCRSIGTPPPDAVTACNTLLRAQLRLCDPEWVLALGATALAAVIPKAKISHVHGRPFYVPAGCFIGRWVFPTFHPAAALRDDSRGADIQADLSTLSELIGGTLPRDRIAARVGKGGKVIL